MKGLFLRVVQAVMLINAVNAFCGLVVWIAIWVFGPITAVPGISFSMFLTSMIAYILAIFAIEAKVENEKRRSFFRKELLAYQKKMENSSQPGK
jgi:hypothetical protein